MAKDYLKATKVSGKRIKSMVKESNILLMAQNFMTVSGNRINGMVKVSNITKMAQNFMKVSLVKTNFTEENTSSFLPTKKSFLF